MRFHGFDIAGRRSGAAAVPAHEQSDRQRVASSMPNQDSITIIDIVRVKQDELTQTKRRPPKEPPPPKKATATAQADHCEQREAAAAAAEYQHS